jgi:hypothetical protein
MQIVKLRGPRFELALEHFRGGEPLTFENLMFRLAPDGALVIFVQSSWEADNVTKHTALEDFERAEKLVEYLTKSSPPFGSVVENRARQFFLGDEQGWHDWIEVCRYEGGSLIWAKGFPRSRSTR